MYGTQLVANREPAIPGINRSRAPGRSGLAQGAAIGARLATVNYFAGHRCGKL